MSPIRRSWCRNLLILAVLCVTTADARAQHGIFLSGGGPIQRGQGGSATANPLDSLGALFWNPATLSALERNEMTFGAEFLFPRGTLSSRIPAGSLGGGFPLIDLAGSDGSDSGTAPLPNFGFVYHINDSGLSVGLGFLTVAGFATNYPASLTNPVLTPPPPIGLGVGRVLGQLEVYQMTPAVSWQVTDRLSVGGGPIINMARLRLSPLTVATPDNANFDFFFTYPDGSHSSVHWGAGFHLGAYFSGEGGWNFGVGFKSPQWFETFRFTSVDELGLPRSARARFDLPWIGSVGVSYTGLPCWTFAADVRYIDYRNTQGFDDSGFAPTGEVKGLGWDSQWVFTFGTQYRVSDRLALRAGYSYNTQAQDEGLAFFNIASPTIIEHTLYAGASWYVTDCLLLSLAYAHGFDNAIEGPIVLPGGTIPGSSVRSKVSADAVMLGLTVYY